MRTIEAKRARGLAACMLAGLVGIPDGARAETETAEEIRSLKARLQQLETRVQSQDRAQRATRDVLRRTDQQVKDSLKRVAYGSPTTSTLGVGKPLTTTPPNHWYDRLSLRGYTQVRYNGILDSAPDRSVVRVPGDSSVGINRNVLIRRARLVLSGDVTDHLFVYIQPDFASTPTGSTTGNFAQLRDAYGDIYFDQKKEYRVRVGQSKIPFSFENMQSSQNRLALDRNDALNSCCRDERDIGAFFYYTPESIRPVFRDLVKNNLKGSGDYGVFALGLYNGQGANRVESNNELHVVSRVTYPYTFSNGQIVEAGVQGYVGRFNPSTAAIGTATPRLRSDQLGFRDQRVGLHAILYPQPFGLQGEFNWGAGPTLNATQTAVETRSLNGGYIQASYKYDDKAFHTGTYFPFVKYQYFNGSSKFEANAPVSKVRDIEMGIEWQPLPEVEFTAEYAKLNRTNLFVAPYRQFRADLFRAQLQLNY